MPQRCFGAQLRRWLQCFTGAACTPFVYKVQCLAERGEWESILSQKVDPRSYTCGVTYQVDSFVAGLVQKNRDLPISGASDGARYNAAIRKFLAGNERCAKTNFRLKASYSRYLETGTLLSEELRQTLGLRDAHEELALYGSLRRMTSFISRVLGPCPGYEDVDFKFGPGATLADKSSMSTVPDKLSSTVTLTARAVPMLITLSETAWGRGHVEDFGKIRSRIVRGNEFFSVDKEATEDRGAAKEPSLNGPVTIWLGGQIKDRLARWGYNLRYNQEVNRGLALKGSVDGFIATVDLRNASNTVSIETVRALLPPAWFRLLSDLRSPFTRIYSHDRRESKDVHLSMFSTMGCGFTFELETLIFLAAARESMWQEGIPASPEVNVSVHGDDVVLPSAAYPFFEKLLAYLGFECNKKKTFAVGPFRESCGGDFWEGKPVRPVYLSALPTQPDEWITLANQLYRTADAALSSGFLRALARMRADAIEELPGHVRKARGPRYLGDIVIHDDRRDTWTLSVGRDQFGPNGTVSIFTYSPVNGDGVRWSGFGAGAQKAAALYGTAIRDHRWRGTLDERVPTRDDVSGHRMKWITLTWESHDHDLLTEIKDRPWLPFYNWVE